WAAMPLREIRYATPASRVSTAIVPVFRLTSIMCASIESRFLRESSPCSQDSQIARRFNRKALQQEIHQRNEVGTSCGLGRLETNDLTLWYSIESTMALRGAPPSFSISLDTLAIRFAGFG